MARAFHPSTLPAPRARGCEGAGEQRGNALHQGCFPKAVRSEQHPHGAGWLQHRALETGPDPRGLSPAALRMWCRLRPLDPRHRQVEIWR